MGIGPSRKYRAGRERAEGSHQQGRPSTQTSTLDGAVAGLSTDTVAVTQWIQQQGRQFIQTLTLDGAVAGLSTDTEAVTEWIQQQGRQSVQNLTLDGAVAGPSTDTVAVAEGSQQQERQSTQTPTLDGAVAGPYTDNVAVAEGSQQQERQSTQTLTLDDGAVAGPSTDTVAVAEGSQQQERQSTQTPTLDGAVAGPSTDTVAVAERIQQQERQSTQTPTLDGVVAGPSTDNVAVAEGSQQQGRQSILTSTVDGAVTGPYTDNVAVAEGSQQQGRQLQTLTLDGAVAGPSTDTVAVAEGSQQQERQSTQTPTLDGAVAGPSTDTVAVAERIQQQERQSTQTPTLDGVVAGPSTDNVAVAEGSQQQGRQSILTSTVDGAVTGPYTDNVAVAEGSQQQGRQSTQTLTLDGAVAGPSADAPAVTEWIQQQGRQSQGRQSTSTTTHYFIGCSVNQYDLSNSSNTSFGSHGHRGCPPKESLRIRIKQLNEVFKETHTLHKAEELLKRHDHVAICGPPGDGKTSTALKICEKYLHKKYEVVFVDNIEVFDVDTIIQRTCDMLVVFDDIFGSVAFPSNLEKIHKVLIALVDGLVNTSFQQEQAAQKKRDEKKSEAASKNKDETKPDADEKPKKPHKLRFIFTSRSYNWNEGCGQMHQFKVSLFKPESVIDSTKTGLTAEEKESIMNSFEKRSKMCGISSEDKNTISQLQDCIFGFPLICQLYYTNPAFQMHNIIDFFQNPVTYLRGDLDIIVREGSSRSATLVLLVLCGGKLNLASFKGKEKSLTDLFQAVKEDVASCTRTDIGREISNFTDTYCTVENHVASFSHPSIYDAAACALGNLNEDLLLKHCSLQFLYERVRLNKADHLKTTHTDDVTNMIYITSSLHPLLISRLVEGVREGCFRWTVGHPVFSSALIVSDFLTQMMADLPDVVHRKEKSSGECFLYWVSLSTNHSLFERSVSLMCQEERSLHSVLTDFYDSIIGCTRNGNLMHLQHIAAILKQHGEYDLNRRTSREKTLLMTAAETGQLGVFNFLLQEGADVSATDKDRYNCLHYSCKSGSKDIVYVIIKQFQYLINDRDGKGNTPVMVCAESGQVEILKFLVSHKADLTLRNDDKLNAFHIACINVIVSVVEYLLTCERINIDMPGGKKDQTAVMMAAERGQYDVYNLLMLKGADLSLTDEDDKDCLMLACVGGNTSILKHLLSLKTFDINRRGGDQRQTSVMMAAKRGDYDVYKLLVLEKADLSLTDGGNMDCLMLACVGGNTSILKHLLSLKTFDINRRGGDQRQTSVMMAAKRGDYDVYKLLVLEKADLSLTDGGNMDCLMLACVGGNTSILKHLLSLKTFDINRRGGDQRQTSVMMAAKRGDYDVYKLLVLEKADLSLTDKHNKDCLIFACEGGNVSIVKDLLSLERFGVGGRGYILKKTLLMIAAEAGQLGVFNFLLQEGADISATDEDRFTCLHLSCKSGSKDIVNVIIEKFQHLINGRDRKGNTPAMLCAKSGQVELLKCLVLNKADLTIRNDNNINTFDIACINGHVSVVEYLLTWEHMSIHRRDRWWKLTKGMMAAEGGHYDVYTLLVSGADLSLTDKYNSHLLMSVFDGGDVSIVKHLLSLKTFDINRRGRSRKQTAVMMAAQRGHYDIYNLLVMEGADLSLTDDGNMDCLMLASKRGYVSIVKHLLTLKTFDINRRDRSKKQTAVMMAAERGHYDIYNLLVLKGADLSLTDDDTKDCLMLACEGGNVSIVKHLLSLKTFDINRREGSRKETAVMMAAAGGHYDIYNLLVLKGADLSLTDTDNEDCLMLACKGGNVSIVKHLLSLKTFDINRRDRSRKQTAVMMTAVRGHCDVFNLLVMEGADLSLSDTGNRNCLMLAFYRGKVSFVKHLLSLKTFDINRRGGSRKQTAVMMAAEGGCSDFYNLLVLEGADLSLIDRDNNDCLMLACLGNKVSIVKHLLSLKILNINRRDSLKEQTAVMIAAEGGHYDIYNLLVLEGADLSLIDTANRDCLMLACIGGDMSIVKHLLSLKIFDINRRAGSRKQTAVMMAAHGGHYDMYNLLVLEGADLSLADGNNMDCLILASERGYVSIVKHLLSLKTLDINRRVGSKKQTAAMMAAQRGDYDVYNLLVLEGVDLSLTDTDNEDCLMLASKRGYVSIVKHLLSLKTLDINRRGRSQKQTAVMMAAAGGHCDVYNLLVMERADLSLTDKNNMDCLMLASKGGYVSIVKHLLTLKTFDINRREGSKKQTAVMIAAEGGHYDIYNLLVMEGADLSLTDDDNKDCLMFASKGGYLSIVKHLLSLKTFDINRRDRSKKQTAVMMAAERGHYDIYNLLVLEGADLSLTDGDTKDCLMFASKGGYVSIVKHLLSLKTLDINRQDRSRKQTAVMMAAQRGDYDIYNLLVMERADLSLTDTGNKDCLMLASEGGNVSIVKHLLSLKTFDINRRDRSRKQTAVMMAAEGGHYDIYNLLELEGADLSLTDTGNKDCLMLACEGGNVSIVKHLLSLKTFDINRRGGSRKQTALMMAAERGHYDVYYLLVLEGVALSLGNEDNVDI
ncbi:uncharacterized protein [Haliotis cracherodii]|uniref:uncharacterized protein n=1 Tax=Haliotis cracherodii TaxID=6455 RepID=UPI0039EC66EB